MGIRRNNKSGDTPKEPFEAVYEKYFSAIYNYVFGQVLHRERAEDIVSDTFMKAMSYYDEFDPSRASVRTWLTNIARNVMIDDFRKGAIRSHSSLDDEENMIEPSYEDEYGIFREETAKEVYQLMTGLTEQERELIGMIYFQNMKNEEIGKVLGINAKAVSERHRRVLAKCRKLASQGDLQLLL